MDVVRHSSIQHVTMAKVAELAANRLIDLKERFMLKRLSYINIKSVTNLIVSYGTVKKGNTKCGKY